MPIQTDLKEERLSEFLNTSSFHYPRCCFDISLNWYPYTINVRNKYIRTIQLSILLTKVESLRTS